METKDNKLQQMCRDYLAKIKNFAAKHGLGGWIDNMIELNKNKQCAATEDEVIALSRLCDDERITRLDIPTMLNKSYRGCVDDGDFDKILKLPRQGVYCKVDAELYCVEHKKNNK